jgi:hypothetical protein
MAPECIANGRSCAPLMRVPQRLVLGPSAEQQEHLERRVLRVASYPSPDLGAYNDPDYVSPALRRAREQLEENEKLFTDRWDDTVFGPAD